MQPRPLKSGDRIRMIAVSPEWREQSTRVVVQRLIDTRRVLVISEIDERGLPWVTFSFRRPVGGAKHHWLVVDDECWVRVKTRR